MKLAVGHSPRVKRAIVRMAYELVATWTEYNTIAPDRVTTNFTRPGRDEP